MSSVSVVRGEPKKLPPIDEIKFISNYGLDCAITREGKQEQIKKGNDFYVTVGGSCGYISRKTLIELNKYIGEMLEE